METGFFKWVWRFNALLIAPGALLVVGLLVWEMTSSLRQRINPTTTTETLVLAPDTSIEAATDRPVQTLRFGAPARHTKSGLHVLPLYAHQQDTNRGFSKNSNGSLLNYLIINTNQQTRRWLFPKADRLILNTRELVHDQNGIDTRLGHVLAIVETDTNNDGRLTRQDTQTLYLTDPQWSAPREIRRGATSILAVEPISPTSFDLLISDQNTSYALRINADTGEILSEQVFQPLSNRVSTFVI